MPSVLTRGLYDNCVHEINFELGRERERKKKISRRLRGEKKKSKKSKKAQRSLLTLREPNVGEPLRDACCRSKTSTVMGGIKYGIVRLRCKEKIIRNKRQEA